MWFFFFLQHPRVSAKNVTILRFDVDHTQTVLNIVRFSDPPNRPPNRHRIDRQSYLLTIFKKFSVRWTPNAMLTMYKQFGHCTIPGSTESGFESGPNWSPERFRTPDDLAFFFALMNNGCDVNHAETVLNIVRFPDPPNRPSNRYRIDDQSNLQAGGLT